MNENMTTQLRQMWETRPVRLPRNQSPRTWFFGVCEGIAVRYQISPVLVRLVVGLSVFLGGLGLWFYLAALLVLPRYGAPLAPIQVLLKTERDPRYSADRTMGIQALVVVALLLLISGIGSGGVTVGGVLGGVLLTGVVWWLLHQRMPVPPAGLQIPSEDAMAEPAVSMQSEVDLGSLTPAKEFTHTPAPTPAWDQLGEAPFAWDSTGNPSSPSDGIGAESLYGGEMPNVPSFTPAPKRSAWRTLGGVTLGIVLAIVLALVGGVSLLVGGVLNSQDKDTSTTSSRRFSETTVLVDSIESDRMVKAIFSDVDVDLTTVAFPKDQDSATIRINSKFSDIAVVLPEKTAGLSYRIHVDCAQVTASRADCSALDGVIVPSVSARGAANPEQRTLTVVVESSMSVVTMLQRDAM